MLQSRTTAARLHGGSTVPLSPKGSTELNSLHRWEATSFTYASEFFFTDLTPTFQNKFNFKPPRGGKTICLPTSGTEFDHCVLTSGYQLTELFTPCLYITFNLTRPEILSGNEITKMKIS